MSLHLLLIILLVLVLLGVIPTWSYSQNWGYGPSGVLTVVLIILIVVVLTGRG